MIEPLMSNDIQNFEREEINGVAQVMGNYFNHCASLRQGMNIWNTQINCYYDFCRYHDDFWHYKIGDPNWFYKE